MKIFSMYLAAVLMTCVGIAQAQPPIKGGCSKVVGNSVQVAPCPSTRNGIRELTMPYSPEIPNWGGGLAAGHVHRSATAAESYGRGMAARVQAQGYYNLLTSQAMINAAEAQRLQMEDKQRRVETYFAMREAYKARQAAESEARRKQASPRADDQALNSRELLSDIGTLPAITWPTALQQAKFSSYRKLIEQVVALRAKGTELTGKDRSRVMEAHRTVLVILKNQAGSEPSADDDDARQFVKNLVAGTIGVDPGKHRLRIAANGLELFAQDFTIASGGRETIHATFEPAADINTPPPPLEQRRGKGRTAVGRGKLAPIAA